MSTRAVLVIDVDGEWQENVTDGVLALYKALQLRDRADDLSSGEYSALIDLVEAAGLESAVAVGLMRQTLDRISWCEDNGVLYPEGWYEAHPPGANYPAHLNTEESWVTVKVQ